MVIVGSISSHYGLVLVPILAGFRLGFSFAAALVLPPKGTVLGTTALVVVRY